MNLGEINNGNGFDSSNDSSRVDLLPSPKIKQAAHNSLLSEIGTELQMPMSAVAALPFTDLNWNVRVCNSAFPDGKGGYVEDPEEKVIVRSDINKKLGTVGTRYVPLQNKTVAAFVDILQARFNLELVRAGHLENGRTVFFICRIPANVLVQKDESPVARYFMLISSHDSSISMRALFLPVREADGAILSAPLLREAGQGLAVRHTSSAGDSLQEAIRAFQSSTDYFKDFSIIANQLADKPFSMNDFINLTDKILKSTESARGSNNKHTLIEAFKNTTGFIPGDYNAWRAFCAVCYWVDHVRSTRLVSGAKIGETRATSILLETGLQIKYKAFDHIYGV